ncbi:MAG: hypothetical protein ABS95_03060 [Verrucomicrobia bacterium SCN 57-15]|nr:MAG: hypothetical protein ABS95_03060 [Verrucomicrobia bacterium SCN 57-15]
MKTKSSLKARTGEVETRTLRIEFQDEQAEAVFIAGTFNDWRPSATPMIPLGEGRWGKELSLAPGRYEYRLVVDGKWICDPAAAENVSNPFGSFNAVLIVPPIEFESRKKP